MTRKKSSAGAAEGFGPLMRQFFQAMRSATEEILAPDGYSMRQAFILLALDRDPGITSAEMAQRMMITPQAMGEMLTDMEGGDLLQRRTLSGNARKRAIFLTPAGRKALSACRAAMGHVEDRMLAPLSAGERKNLCGFLARCIAGAKNPAPVKRARPARVS